MDKWITSVKRHVLDLRYNQLKRMYESEKQYFDALDVLQKEAYEKKQKAILRKHEHILYDLELQTLSDDMYAHEVLKDAYKKIVHRMHLKGLRIMKKTRVKRLTKDDVLSLNQSISDAFTHKQQKVLSKRSLILTRDDFEQKKEMLKKVESQYLKEVQEKLVQKYDKKRARLQTKTSKLSEHLKKYKKIREINNSSSKELDPNTILSIEHLSMHFDGLKAVDDLSFDVKKGEIFGLIGPNGAGKTTVFNCITQFYKVTEGNIYFHNKDAEVIKLNHLQVHQVIHQGIARTFQNVELVYELSVLDNMLVGAHALFNSSFFSHLLHTPNMKKEEKLLKLKAIKILTELGLYYYKDVYPIGLPYGILKKIELARVLMTDPSLIILDEPAAGLNDIETLELAKTIKHIQESYQTTIFLVEHDMGLVMDVCDTICAISFGKKLAIGTPKDIQSNPVVQQAYLGGESNA